MLYWRRWGLAARLTLAMTVLVIVAVVGVTLLTVQREQENFRNELEQQALLLLGTLEVTTRDALYLLDADFIKGIIGDIGHSPSVTSAIIYDRDGRTLADSSRPGELAFNLESDAFGQQLVASSEVYLDWQDTSLVAGKAVIIGNQRLGAVSVALPTAPLVSKMEAVRNEGFGLALVAAVVGLLISLVVSRTITGPLRELTEATERISSGDLSHRITLPGGDELSMLGSAFNRMAGKLEESLQKVEQRAKDFADANQDLMREIAERKRAEAELARSRELLQLVMDTIPQSICWKDRDSVFLGCNRSFAAVLNIPSPEWVVGKTDFDLSPADQAEAYRSVDRRVMESNTPELDFEEPHPRLDGSIGWLRTNKAPLHDLQGNVVGLLVTFEDITERKQAEQEREGMIKELQVANARVLEASRLKSEFLATMSHELRTPLNSVIGFSGIMLEGMAGQIDDQARYMVQAIYDSSHTLLRLINDVLDLSKIEAGRMELVVAPLSIPDLVEQWQAQMEVIARQKGLPFDVEVDPAVPQLLYGDKDRIRQIVVNLLSNAFKFTESGQVKLEVGWDSEALVIRVCDTGVGIPPHALTYIFDEFRQVDSSSQRQYGGTGLGLAIVRRLCLMMGGNVQVSSKIGEGSVFTVSLPLAPAA